MAGVPDGFVDLAKFDSSLVIDLKYATNENFMGKVLYANPVAYLRKPVAERLRQVQLSLQVQGFGIKIWDAYRPFTVQKRMWAHTPNENFIGKPVEQSGRLISGSKHNRGAALDVTLVDRHGIEVEMPTPFDEFSARASRAYAGGSVVSREHRWILEQAMSAHDFVPHPYEWWHFDDPDWQKYELFDFGLE